MITENQSCLSWGGFNLMGDEKSISEAQRLLNRNGRLDAIEHMIASKQLVYPDASSAQAVDPADPAVGFVKHYSQPHPDMAPIVRAELYEKLPDGTKLYTHPEHVKGDAVARIQRGMDNQLYAMLLPSPCAEVHAGQVLYTHPERAKVPDGWEIDVGKKNAAIRHRSGQKLVIKKDLGNVLLFDLFRELAAAIESPP